MSKAVRLLQLTSVLFTKNYLSHSYSNVLWIFCTKDKQD